jgi:hypothetical protein
MSGKRKPVKKIFIIPAFILLTAALITGGIFAWQGLSVGAAAVKDNGEAIIVIDPAEDPAGAVDAYVKLTGEQAAILKQRAERNMTRVAEEGAELTDVEMREITNHILAAALNRTDVELNAVYLVPGLYDETGAEAWCMPEYNPETKQARATILVERASYDGAKKSIGRLVRYLFLLTHEVGHGLEPEYALKPATLTGLAFNLVYDARLTLQPFTDNESRTLLDERIANVFCCSLMLEEFDFILKHNIQISGPEGIDLSSLEARTYEWQYGDSITDNTRRMLPMLMSEISGRFNTMPLFDTPVVDDVIAAYAAGTIAPSEMINGLFDRGGTYGLPTYGEFIKYMDEAYGIGQITSGLKEETLNEIRVTQLKQFTLCAPFVLGMKDTPYKSYSYDQYLDDLFAEHSDYTRIKDIERIFATEWAASMSNAEFNKIIASFL